MTVPSCTCAACRWLHPPPPSGLVLGQKQGGVHVPRRSHDAIPICHLADFIHIMCVVTRNLRLGKSPGASCAKKACGNPDRTMLDFRHLSRPQWCTEQGRSGTSTAALHPKITGIERWSDISMYLVLQIHGSSATSRTLLQFLGGARNNLELARSTNRQAQRSIALWETVSLAAQCRVRHRPEDHCSNVSSPSQERHWLALVRVH